MLGRKPKKRKHPERISDRPKHERVSLKAVFQTIWETRPHVCELCGKKLMVPKAHNFAHIKARGRGGNPDGSRNVPENIKLLCYPCHTELDTGRRPKNADWMD